MNTKKLIHFFKKISVSVALVLSIPYLHASLMAVTSKTIQGSAPEITAEGGLVPADKNDVIRVILPDNTVYFGNTPSNPHLDSTLIPDNSSPSILVDKNTTFDAFQMGFEPSQYKDSNGDNFAAFSGSWTYTWTDKYGTVHSSMTDILDSCLAPYELNISVNNAQVHSLYGDPASSSPATLNKKFYIYVNDFNRICGVKPLSMTWYLPNATTHQMNPQSGYSAANKIDSALGGGYYSNSTDSSPDFDPIKGFSADKLEKFPTTAFPNAAFSLIFPEPQNSYTITNQTALSGLEPIVQATQNTSNPHQSINNMIKFDGAPGSKPASTITLKITNSIDSTVSQYTFSVSTWVRTYGRAVYPGVDSWCNFLPRNKLSNSHLVSLAAGSSLEWYNAATRKVGTLIGEWGNLQHYPNAGFDGYPAWTSETYDTNNEWVVYLDTGGVFIGAHSDPFVYVCEE